MTTTTDPHPEKEHDRRSWRPRWTCSRSTAFAARRWTRSRRRLGCRSPICCITSRRKRRSMTALLMGLMDTWLDPLREMDPDGNPVDEIVAYVLRKLEMARDYPRESRLFANEIVQGAPRILDQIKGPLRDLVDDKAESDRGWIRAGKLARDRPAPPDLLDLVDDPALRRFRCSGPRHSAAGRRRTFRRSRGIPGNALSPRVNPAANQKINFSIMLRSFALWSA